MYYLTSILHQENQNPSYNPSIFCWNLQNRSPSSVWPIWKNKKIKANCKKALKILVNRRTETQWPKEKQWKNKTSSNTYRTKTMCELRCSRRIHSSSFTRGTRHFMFLNITSGGILGWDNIVKFYWWVRV